MSALPGLDRPAETPGGTMPAGPARHGRLRAAAAAHEVPLAAILVTVAVVDFTYLAANSPTRIRDVLLMLLVAVSSPAEPGARATRRASTGDRRGTS